MNLAGNVTPQEQSANRRRFQRFAIPVEVNYGVGDELVSGKALDLSEGGIGFVGEKKCRPGEYIPINFWFDSPIDKLFTVGGRVRHVSEARMGAEFVNLEGAERAEILQAIQQYLNLHGRRR